MFRLECLSGGFLGVVLLWPVLIDPPKGLVAIVAGRQGERPLGGGFRLVAGDGLGVGADGLIFHGTLGRGGEPFSRCLIVVLGPTADHTADAAFTFFPGRQFFADPLDPIAGFRAFDEMGQSSAGEIRKLLGGESGALDPFDSGFETVFLSVPRE